MLYLYCLNAVAMSPEYAMQGLFLEKSDVFNFGVLLLEIVCGTRNTSFYDDEEPLTLFGLVSICTYSFGSLYEQSTFCC